MLVEKWLYLLSKILMVLRVPYLLLLILLSVACYGQTYNQVTHLSGTQTVNGTGVTVTAQGGAGTLTSCGIGPYWIGNGNVANSYKFSFSRDIMAFRVIIGAANLGEIIRVSINGTKYNLTNTNLSGYTGSCSAGGFVTSSGDITTTTASLNGYGSANCQLDISYGQIINYITIEHVNGTNAGSTFDFSFLNYDTSVSIVEPFNDTLLCAGDTFLLPFTTTSNFKSNNVFTAQLSAADGSFANPTNIGSRPNANSGSITCIIPPGTPTGGDYRLRILTTSPQRTSNLSDNKISIGRVPIAKPVALNNSPICNGDTIKLQASTTTVGVSYKWTGPSMFTSDMQNPEILSPDATNAGDYIVTAYINGCIAKDTTTVSVFSITSSSPDYTTSNSPVCKNDTVFIYHNFTSSPLSYSWTGPGGFISGDPEPIILNVDANKAGDYFLSVTNGTCTVKDTVSVGLKSAPANFGAVYNGPVCESDTIKLSASSVSSGVTYTWAGPGGFSSVSADTYIGNATLMQSGDYYVTATYNSCDYLDTVSVIVKPRPVKPIASNNSAICEGDTLRLRSSTTTPGVTYQWNGPMGFNDMTQNPIVDSAVVAMSGVYVASADLDGCDRKDTTIVIIKPLPAIVAASSNSPVCAGKDLMLQVGTSTAGTQYSWMGPGGYTSNKQNPSLVNIKTADSGWYITTLNLDGCIIQDSTKITVLELPLAPELSYNNPICPGETLQLSATDIPGVSYSWQGANGFTATVQNPNRDNMQFGDTGTYTVNTIQNGCLSLPATIMVQLNPLPLVSILSEPEDSICSGDIVNYTAIPANYGGSPEFAWYVNGKQAPAGVGAQYQSSTINDKDVVHCVMTEHTQCSEPKMVNSNAVTMTVLPKIKPRVTISSDADTIIVEGDKVLFKAIAFDAGDNPSFQWLVNDVPVPDAITTSWLTEKLHNRDVVSIKVYSSYQCPEPADTVSDEIKFEVRGRGGSIKELVLYPNPNNGRFKIKADLLNSSNVQLNIINLFGQLVYTDVFQPDKNRLFEDIDVSYVASGIYLLEAIQNSSKVSIKFVMGRQ